MSVGPEHFSGKIVEQELFGKTEKESRRVEYLSFPISMDLVRRLQPEDPKDPKPDFAYEVLMETERLLGIKNQDKLSFYTAIGSALDQFHSIDGWFELDDGRMVTIDLTTNPNKGEYRANIVFLVPRNGLDRNVDSEEFLEYSHSLAQKITEFFDPTEEDDPSKWSKTLKY